ncbi:photosystem II 5 kDa protein, chloroplastic-like [Magnolia sinica]|uniref:photosystem II 5 kDa protein, chloroplastic-like n=1 Tax=Magnolia sinica TaxID=86752 RepID=UPI002657F319|nr:photosystem II 5 kDa protein, chloroplastic-like [Magnolia sinica]
MASVTMTASFLGSITASDRPSVNRRRLMVAKAAKVEGNGIEKLNFTNKDSSKNNNNNTRRDVMFAAAAAAVSSIVGGVGIAIATEEPKRGTPEAKKIYAPVCVTMPTARICHK